MPEGIPNIPKIHGVRKYITHLSFLINVREEEIPANQN